MYLIAGWTIKSQSSHQTCEEPGLAGRWVHGEAHALSGRDAKCLCVCQLQLPGIQNSDLAGWLFPTPYHRPVLQLVAFNWSYAPSHPSHTHRASVMTGIKPAHPTLPPSQVYHLASQLFPPPYPFLADVHSMSPPIFYPSPLLCRCTWHSRGTRGPWERRACSQAAATLTATRLMSSSCQA